MRRRLQRHQACAICGRITRDWRRCDRCREYYCLTYGKCGTIDGARCSKCPDLAEVDREIVAAICWTEDAVLDALDQPRGIYEIGERIFQVRNDAPRPFVYARINPLYCVHLALESLVRDGVVTVDGSRFSLRVEAAA